MSLIRKKLDAARQRVIASEEIGDGHKEALSDMLLASYEASNGAPDKIQALTEAVAAQGICLARDAEYRKRDIREIVSQALTDHKLHCQLAAKTSTEETAITADTRWGRFKASGRGAMKPVIQIVGIIALAVVMVKTAGQLQAVSDQVKQVSAALHQLEVSR